MTFTLADVITLTGLLLLLFSWVISFHSTLHAALRKWSFKTIYRAFVSGKRKTDLLVKLFGTIGVVALLISMLIEITPNAIGQEAHAATHDIALRHPEDYKTPNGVNMDRTDARIIGKHNWLNPSNPILGQARQWLSQSSSKINLTSSKT